MWSHLKIRRVVFGWLVCAALLAEAACSGGVNRNGEVDSSLLAAFGPLPVVMESAQNPHMENRVSLGRLLYHDKRLSISREISCNTCHPLAEYGMDGRPVSEGHRGQMSSRNAPTVYNAAGHFVQFWDGRTASVEEQAMESMLNPVEMAMASEEAVVAELISSPGYTEEFQKAFPQLPDPVTFDSMAMAIGAFERTLVTPSRWDEFLQGNSHALSEAEVDGFIRFVEAGCVGCHRGVYVGGDMYNRLGIVKPWPDTSDLGRFQVTKHNRDKFVFKVPSLRNIEKTGPYFHNGSVTSLEGAIQLMDEYQLGTGLADNDIASIVNWLNALTGSIPVSLTDAPENNY